MKYADFFRARLPRAVLCAFILAASISAGAEPPPTLKALADKFAAERAALTAAGEAQLKPTRDRYLAALEAARKVATAAAKTGDITAIGAEISGTTAGALPEAFPPDLPRTLLTDRRTYVSAAANVARTIPPRLRELAAKYLQALAGLEASVSKSGDAELATAIAAEQKRATALIEASGGAQKNRNIVANGDFSMGQPGAAPSGWRPEMSWVSVTDATLVVEGTEKFLRFRRLQVIRNGNLVPDKEVVIPANARSVEFGVKIRVKGLVPGTEWGTYPALHLTARDARGEEVGGETAAVKQDTSWKRLSGKFALPATAKTLRVSMGPQCAAGVVDFDDIVVEFR